MFKTLKYIFLASLYKKAKKNFKMLFIYIIALILINLIVDDLMGVTTNLTIYILLAIKWSSTFVLWYLIGHNIFKIFNMATNPFEQKEDLATQSVDDTTSSDSKKKRILDKDKLLTKSDLIIQKYMKD